MKRVLGFLLAAVGGMGSLLCGLALINPGDAKLADDGDPFGGAGSGLAPLIGLIISVGLAALGLWLSIQGRRSRNAHAASLPASRGQEMLEDVEELRRAGFEGFVTIDELRGSRLSAVPEAMGVYVVLRTDREPPIFLERSPAGRFKDKDWTVPVERLSKEWVKGAAVLYIGKAGESGQKAALRSRLRQYLRFGEGCSSPHAGGRLIWQVAGSQLFQVCWKATPNERPRDVEQALIAAFKTKHGGRRPFANLQD